MNGYSSRSAQRHWTASSSVHASTNDLRSPSVTPGIYQPQPQRLGVPGHGDWPGYGAPPQRLSKTSLSRSMIQLNSPGADNVFMTLPRGGQPDPYRYFEPVSSTTRITKSSRRMRTTNGHLNNGSTYLQDDNESIISEPPMDWGRGGQGQGYGGYGQGQGRSTLNVPQGRHQGRNTVTQTRSLLGGTRPRSPNRQRVFGSTASLASGFGQTEVKSVDPELRQARKQGDRYQITLNVNPTLGATQAPAVVNMASASDQYNYDSVDYNGSSLRPVSRASYYGPDSRRQVETPSELSTTVVHVRQEEKENFPRSRSPPLSVVTTPRSSVATSRPNTLTRYHSTGNLHVASVMSAPEPSKQNGLLTTTATKKGREADKKVHVDLELEAQPGATMRATSTSNMSTWSTTQTSSKQMTTGRPAVVPQFGPNNPDYEMMINQSMKVDYDPPEDTNPILTLEAKSKPRRHRHDEPDNNDAVNRVKPNAKPNKPVAKKPKPKPVDEDDAVAEPIRPTSRPNKPSKPKDEPDANFQPQTRSGPRAIPNNEDPAPAPAPARPKLSDKGVQASADMRSKGTEAASQQRSAQIQTVNVRTTDCGQTTDYLPVDEPMIEKRAASPRNKIGWNPPAAASSAPRNFSNPADYNDYASPYDEPVVAKNAQQDRAAPVPSTRSSKPRHYVQDDVTDDISRLPSAMNGTVNGAPKKQPWDDDAAAPVGLSRSSNLRPILDGSDETDARQAAADSTEIPISIGYMEPLAGESDIEDAKGNQNVYAYARVQSTLPKSAYNDPRASNEYAEISSTRRYGGPTARAQFTPRNRAAAESYFEKSSFGPRTAAVDTEYVRRLMQGAPVGSVVQTVHMEKEEEEVVGPIPGQGQAGAMSAEDGILNFDTVSEQVDLRLQDGEAQMVVRVVCERLVPIKGKMDVYKKTSVVVTRTIDVDLTVTTERRQLYDDIVANKRDAPDGRLSSSRTFELYQTFMAMADADEAAGSGSTVQEMRVDKRVDEERLMDFRRMDRVRSAGIELENF